jgi:hypothetical protein
VGFYEAAFVKTRCEKCFLFYFWLILTGIWRQPTCLALALDRCGARHERRNDQTPKSVTFERAT